jgi:hypothetical protein
LPVSEHVRFNVTCHDGASESRRRVPVQLEHDFAVSLPPLGSDVCRLADAFSFGRVMVVPGWRDAALICTETEVVTPVGGHVLWLPAVSAERKTEKSRALHGSGPKALAVTIHG